jgi:cytosine/adenosine deaminase-related metal-dependent hydrolase
MVHYGGAPRTRPSAWSRSTPRGSSASTTSTGSIDVGKDADLVIWNMDPLSTYARAEKVYIDGDLFFDSSFPAGTRHILGMHADNGVR